MSSLLALLLTGVKLGPLLTTAGTMVLSIVLYGYAFGWVYGAGLVVMLFVHEMGHYLAARQCGVAVGPPIFIPFVGAWVALKDQPVDAEAEAYIVIAGPFVGTVFAFAAYLLGREYDSSALMAVAYAGFVLNLFNLLPFMPLDGGRLTEMISPRLWWIGLPLLLGLFIYLPNPLIIFVLVLGLPYVIKGIRQAMGWEAPDNQRPVPLQVKVEYGALYLLLAAVLAAMTYNLHEMLRFAR